MARITTKITPFTRSPSRQKPETFSEDMDIRLSEENSRIEQMNTQSDEMNAVADEVQGLRDDTARLRNEADSIRNDALNAKNEAVTAKDLAIDAKEYIESYVVPTDATYTPEAIDAKVRMSQILAITNSI